MNEYRVTLSLDGYWDNTKVVYVVAKNVEEAEDRAQQKKGGGYDVMDIEQLKIKK